MEQERGFWERAQVEMERRHLSMAQLGKLSQVSEQTIVKGILTRGVPQADSAMRIADALEVPLRQLLEGEAEAGDRCLEKRRNTMKVLQALPLLSENQEELLLKILKVWKVVE